MYAKGMTENDIAAHIEEIYGLDVSDSTISRVTDKILPIAKEWQSRPLEEVYAVVFMDAIHYHVRYEGRIVKKGCIYSNRYKLRWQKRCSWHVVVKMRVQNSGFLS